MAKIHNYYVLCPLIDQKSFLGVSQGQDRDDVIVTLGRNVVNKYRLSDQKQIGGWTSKDHITSDVVYDGEQNNYVAVFNNNTIKMWTDDSDNLDKLKKHKFPLNILKLVYRGKWSPLVIFNNGNCVTLSYAIDNRKTYESKGLLRDNEVILDTACYTINMTNHICYIVKKNKDSYEIIYCPIRDEIGDMDKSKLNRIKITRTEDVHVVGKHMANQKIFVVWSDSKITMFDLTTKCWKTIGTVPWISTLTGVSLAWMGKHHIILFGRNIEQDGAIIVAYNIILGVGSCRYPMKMYSEGARLYCFHNHIILEASNHIGMLPYVLETKRNLSSLLGSHDIIQDEFTEIADWDTPTVPLYDVNDEIKDLLKLGLTERTICAHVLPPLLEKGDFRHVFRITKIFKDVPESVLVQLLNYAINLVNVDKIDVTEQDQFIKFCNGDGETAKQSILRKAKFKLLNHIFQIPFSDALLIPYLKNSLTLNDTLFLMTYISHILMDPYQNQSMEYENKLFDWCISIMDAFYQQYLITKDEKVTYVLDKTEKTVLNLVNQLYEIDNVLPLLNKIISGKVANTTQESLSYTIEMIEI